MEEKNLNLNIFVCYQLNLLVCCDNLVCCLHDFEELEIETELNCQAFLFFIEKLLLQYHVSINPVFLHQML